MTATEPRPALEAVGAVILSHRAALGLRQADVAEHCGCDRAFVSYIERGQRNPSLQTMLCIADRLDVKLSELMREAGL